MISGKTVIQKKRGTLSTIVDEEAVVLGIESGNYFGFNKIASEIWERIEDPVKLDMLISELESTYSGDGDSIRNDVIKFLETLHEKALIELIDENKS